MSLTRQQIDWIGDANEVHVSTYRADGSRRRSVPIWTVRVDDDLYIRSAFGPNAAWFRNATAGNRLHLEAGSEAVDVALELTADVAVNAQVDTAYRSKYPDGGNATTIMVSPPATGSTAKLLSVAV